MEMDSLRTFRLREPTWDDLEPAAEVLAADDLDDAGKVVLDTGFLRGQWQRSGFDLTTDAWVAVDSHGDGRRVRAGHTRRDRRRRFVGSGASRVPRAGHRIGAARADRGSGT